MLRCCMNSDLDKDIREAQEALADWPMKPLDEDSVICECFCVSVSDIKETCPGSLDLVLLRQTFGFGNGCGTCIKDLEKWKNIF